MIFRLSSPEAIATLPPSVASHYGILSIAMEGDTVVLVSKMPLSEDLAETIQSILGSRKSRIAGDTEFQQYRNNFDALLSRYYPPLGGQLFLSEQVRSQER